MKNRIAIIPLRGGSKGIPGKNKKRILGRPLYQWVLSEAILSMLDIIYVFTDDIEILDYINDEYIWCSKVIGIQRSKDNATDISSTEDAMLEFATKIDYNFDIICLLQATSPLTKASDINNCLALIKDDVDSTLSVVETKRFIWRNNGTPINYDMFNRPRRQDFQGLIMENGAVYASTKEAFLKSKNRISGNISLSYMNEESLYEIDEYHDFLVLEKLIETELQKNKKQPKLIKAIVFDIDGVMTNGTVLTGEKNEIAKSFSLRDGMGLSFLNQDNIIPIIMTSENSPIVKTRIQKLKINQYYPGTRDKYSRLDSILAELDISREEVAYVGDDINDLTNMLSVGWSFCPENSVSQIKDKADIILHNKGGDLAVREAIDYIIKYNKRF